MSDFAYTVLDKAEPSFRLLTLHPAKDRTSPLKCSLSNTSLNELPDFEALSYTWGSPIEGDKAYESPASDQTILLNDMPFTIRKNLFDALTQLRLADASLVLWIDAICINQTDIDERNHQVRQMEKIYRSAKRVVVWLGEKDAYTDEAIEWLGELAEMQGHYDRGGLLPDDYVLGTHTGPENMDRLIQSEEYLPKWNALQHIVGRSWWNRVWTVQELALSASLVVRMGDIEIPWETIDMAFRGISPRKDTLQICLVLANGSGTVDDVVNWARPLNHWMLWSFTQYINSGAHKDPSRTSIAAVHSDDVTMRWYKVLQATSSAQCHDSRDRVYGVLGLCEPSIRTSIPTDYNLPAAMLFSQATVRLISGLKSLSVLTNSFLETCFKVSAPMTVPSWVPQNRHPLPSKIDSQDHERYSKYQASLHHQCHATVSDDYSTLATTGVLVDRIAKVGEPVRDFSTLPADMFATWSSILDLKSTGREVYKHRTKDFKYATWEEEETAPVLTMLDIFWLVLSMGFPPGQINQSNDSGERFIFHLGGNMGNGGPDFSQIARCRFPPKNDEEIHDLIWMFQSASRQHLGGFPALHRRLFVTHDGFVGMGPESAQEGDHVAVLHGSRVPYVLRHEPSKDEYRFVDECYVQGMMQGEIVEDQGAGKYELQSILLC